MKSKLHWSEVKLFDGGITLIEDEEMQRKYMTEYRETGSIHGIYFSDTDDPAEMADIDDDMKKREIDWTGI